MLFREQREYKVLALTSGHGSHLLLACCVASGKSLALSELPFSHLHKCKLRNCDSLSVSPL